MLAVFLVTFPFFALIAAGYGAARARILPLDAIPGLNTFVLYFALPCMLLRFGAGTPIGQLLDGSVALVWGICALAVARRFEPLSEKDEVRMMKDESRQGHGSALFHPSAFILHPFRSRDATCS